MCSISPARTRRFEIFTAVVPQTEVQTLSDRGLLDHVGVSFELVADCGANEIGTVRVEALLHHQVDLAKVDVTEIGAATRAACNGTLTAATWCEHRRDRSG